MKAVRLSIIVCCVLVLASCSLKPAWDVVGKWQKVDGEETLEFSRNGAVTMVSGATTFTGTFRFTDAKHMEMNAGSLGIIVTQVTASANNLILTDVNGKVTKFRKVK